MKCDRTCGGEVLVVQSSLRSHLLSYPKTSSNPSKNRTARTKPNWAILSGVLEYYN